MLREKTQRRLFRIVFLLGCVLPTLALASWSAVRLHHDYQHWMLGLAGYSLGVELQCEKIATPRPGEYEIEGLRISYEGELLAQCNQVHIQQTSNSWRFVGDECIVMTTSGELPRLSGKGSLTTIEGKIATLTLADMAGEAICTWRRVQCRVDGEPLSSADPLAAAWTEANENAQPTQCALYRMDGKHRIEIQTGSTPLPLQLIPSILPEYFARVASFSGAALAEIEQGEQRGQANGVLEVAKLNGSHASWSNAQVEILDLAWTGNQIDRLHAHLEAREGSLDRLFVWGLYQMLKCHPEQALERIWNNMPEDAPIPFGQLACEVELDSSGLTLYGRCGEINGEKRPGAIAHAVLADGKEALLLEPRERMQSPTNLVRAMWPDQAPEIPATPEAQAMASRLPTQTTTD